MPGVRFAFKRLDVYQAALEFWQWALRVATRILRNRFFVTDQFLRAALSVSLNIAESAGTKTPAEAANHCRHAAGSTTECAAMLDSLRAMQVISEKEYDEQEERLARIVAMLTQLLQRHQRRSRNRTT